MQQRDNALLLENLLHGRDDHVNIVRDRNDSECEYDFIVGKGDDLFHLSNLIGRSNCLKSLCLRHMPTNTSFGDALAENKSIQKLEIGEDLGEEGYRCLAPFFRNTITLEQLAIDDHISRSAFSLKNIASLLSRYQTKSLKRIYLEAYLEAEGS